MNKAQFIFGVLLLITNISWSQSSGITGSNNLNLVLTTNKGELKLRTDKMRASYDKSIGFFKLQVDLSDFEVEFESRTTDRRLYRRFLENNVQTPLTILIYIEERPFRLDSFQDEDYEFDTRIELEHELFKTTSRVSARTEGNSLLMSFYAVNKPPKPVYLFSYDRLKLKQIEIYSPQTVIFDFLGYN